MSTDRPGLLSSVPAGLASVLADAGYDAKAVAERLRVGVDIRVREADVPLLVHRLNVGDRLDGLIRMFLFRLPVEQRQAEQTLSPVPPNDLVELGLLEDRGDAVQATVRLTPHAGRWFAHDSNDPATLRPDSVLGWTGSARTLADLTVRRPVGTVLDLGTGCGCQAILAAEHAERVVAVDINPRALWLTELNCALNGVRNVECREGDLFGPVEGETFDLIVSNPLFVISPDTDYIFRDGGRDADSLSREVVAGAASALRENGVATVLCNWVISGDELWWSRPASWLEGRGCDTLLLYYETVEAMKYAGLWVHHGSLPSQDYQGTIDRWLEYYRTAGVDGVGVGALILRRRSGTPNWLRKGQIGNGPTGASSDQLLRMFEAQDALASMNGGDDDLLTKTFELVDPHRLRQVLRYEEGRYLTDDAEMELEPGLGLRNRVVPEALHVLLRMDGARRLGELLDEAAEDTDLDPESLAPKVVPCVRELFELGLLRLVG